MIRPRLAGRPRLGSKAVSMRATLIAFILLVTACDGGGASPITQPAEATAITCTAAYRANVSQSIEREESLVFTDRNEEQSIVFPALVFHAAYQTGEVDHERALRLWVTDAERGTTYQTQLYQLDFASGPQNQFRGGHGFTGLSYSYHPTSGAEMQFWCEAS